MKNRVLRWAPYGFLLVGAGGVAAVGGMVHSLMGIRLLLLVGMVWGFLATALWAMHVLMWPSFEGTLPWRFFLRPAAWMAGCYGIRLMLLSLLPPPLSPFVWIPGLRFLAPPTDILWMLGFLGAWWELQQATEALHARSVALGLWGLAAVVMLPFL